MTALRQDDAPRGFVTKAEHYAALRQIDELQEELAQYRDALGEMVDEHRVMLVRAFLASKKPSNGQARWASGQMAKALIVLVERGSVSRSQFGRLGPKDWENGTKVLMHHLRAQLERLGAPTPAIETTYGFGYAMTPEARQWLRERVPEAFKTGGAP